MNLLQNGKVPNLINSIDARFCQVNHLRSEYDFIGTSFKAEYFFYAGTTVVEGQRKIMGQLGRYGL